MEDLRHGPEHTQNQEDTHERWQMGQRFEHWYETETTHTQPEDDVALGLGVVVMGLEKITFGWYMKKITWVAFVGYLAGILVYWLEKALLF